MEIHERERLKGQKYLGVAISALLVMGFVIMQPIQVFGQPDPLGDCKDAEGNTTTCIINLEDGIAMNTVRSGKFVLTVHAEKEVFHSVDPQDRTNNRITDVTIIGLIYENLNKLPGDPVISTQVHGFTCEKKENTAQLLGCSSGGPGISPRGVIEVDECVDPSEEPAFGPTSNSQILPLTHPQEMNTITKGNIAKTIEAQKEIFVCEIEQVDVEVPGDPDPVIETVPVGSWIKEIVIFTETYEDLSTHSIIGEPRFIAMTCLKGTSGLGFGPCMFENVLN